MRGDRRRCPSEVQTFRATSGRVTGRDRPGDVRGASPRSFVVDRAPAVAAAGIARLRVRRRARLGGDAAAPASRSTAEDLRAARPCSSTVAIPLAAIEDGASCASYLVVRAGERRVRLPGHRPLAAPDGAHRDEVARQHADARAGHAGRATSDRGADRRQGRRGAATPTSSRPRSSSWPTPTGSDVASRRARRRSTSSAARLDAGGPGSRSALRLASSLVVLAVRRSRWSLTERQRPRRP